MNNNVRLGILWFGCVSLIVGAIALALTPTSNTSLQDIVKIRAEKYNIPITLAMALVERESSWNPLAVSKARAVGLCQMLPETFLIYAEEGERNIFLPEDNVEAGMKMLADLYDRYGDWWRVLCHYNGGTKGHTYRVAREYADSILRKCEYK